MPAAGRCSGSNVTMTRAVDSNDIEIASNPNHAAPDAALDVLIEHKRQQSKTQKKKERDLETASGRACQKWCWYITVVQAVIIPITTFSIAMAFAQDENSQSLLLLIPGSASLGFLMMMAYRERGPGGMLEHSGAKLGCLGVRVAQPGEM